MHIKHIFAALGLCTVLAACGDTIADQAIAGTAIGAGAAVITNGTIAKGAVIGAAGNIAYCQLYPGRC